MTRRWSKESIGLEIRALYDGGANLSYSAMAKSYLPLLRAATRHFGSWEAAISFAGLDYDAIRQYKTWSRQRIIDRIHELHSEGVDLSWRNLSEHIDPQLAAAATKKSHFGSWREAIEAAGLDYDDIRRYKSWTDDRILAGLRERADQGEPLNAKNVQHEDITLITAARRRYDSWHLALKAAGFDYRSIVQRAPFKRKKQCPEAA